MYKVAMYNVKMCHLQTYQQPYTRKKREVRLFLTLLKGFAIPALSRKTTEVHARYVQPTRP